MLLSPIPSDMGSTFCRHRRPVRPQTTVHVPTFVFHDHALRRLRAKFGASWRECGELKQVARNMPELHDPEAAWARMVSHRLITFKHHSMSQTLKEIHANKRAELYD